MVSRNPFARFLFLTLGLFFTAIGAIGVVLPVLPNTPFLLLAGILFIKSSRRLHSWLMNHPVKIIFMIRIPTYREDSENGS